VLTEIMATLIFTTNDFLISTTLLGLFFPVLLLAGGAPNLLTLGSGLGLILSLGGLQLVWLSQVLDGRFRGPWSLRFIPSVVVSRARPATHRQDEAGLFA
jgi:hypothetical protein